MPFRVVLPDAAAPAVQGGTLNADPSVVAAIRSASKQSGTRFDVMLASATMESGLNPAAQSTSSSAKGLFQFVDQTWLQAVRDYGPAHGLGAEAAAVVRRGAGLTVDDPALRRRIMDLRKDPNVASELAGDHLRAISDKLTATLGRAPDATETYLGHFLGSAGAGQILQALQSTPNRPAAALLPDAARANPSMFSAPDGTQYTVTQFMAHLRGKVARVYAALGTAMPQEQIGLADNRSPDLSADPPQAGASGWGSSPSVHRKSPMETQVTASLSDVFTRMDQDMRHHRATRSKGLPPALLSALQA